MTMRQLKLFANGLVGLACMALLVGCSDTTYGTGSTATEQLATDVSGLVTFGATNKKKKIDYSARPKLVKAPASESLPTPAEKVESESAYFPTDPETKRRALIASANGDEVSPEVAALRRESLANQKNVQVGNRDQDLIGSPQYIQQQNRELKQRRARQAAELQAEGRTQRRRYLTEPPDEYRTPASTAPVGAIGEKEIDPTKAIAANGEKKTSLFKKIFGG